MRVIVGTDVGVVKAYSIEEKKVVQTYGTPAKGQQIDRMCWGRGVGDQRENEIVCAVRTSATSTKLTFMNAHLTPTMTLPVEGVIKGLTMLPDGNASGRQLLSCSEAGQVVLHTCPESAADAAQAAPVAPAPIMSLRQPVGAVRLSSDFKEIAAGGKNMDLAVWDLNVAKPKWTAKNVLDRTRVAEPIWVGDLHFVPQHEKQIAVTTGYGQVRLYDMSAQRVPVMKVQLAENPLTCGAISKDGRFVVCGDTLGYMYQFDVRTGRLMGTLRGSGGALRGIEMHDNMPLVVSAGLDRHLRVHNTSTRALTCKVYAKLRMSALLFSAEGPVRSRQPDEDEVKDVKTEELDDDWDVFGAVETVGDEEPDAAESSSDEEEIKKEPKEADKGAKSGKKRAVKIKKENEQESFFTMPKKPRQDEGAERSKKSDKEKRQAQRSKENAQRAFSVLS
eukprot:TRINITY_DN7848_c0_g1_i2.p1 TRINITY_DN7848_c0_g1~~TRINITY_DN7848_c0_g1_i2.p1  ORF type:complete len:447 (-),score=124.45 TRINITY_DN7848_c0_g1_i2:77-1417(-)